MMNMSYNQSLELTALADARAAAQLYRWIMKEEYTLFEWLLGFTLFITIFWSLIGWRFKDAKKYEDFASSNVPGGTPLVRQFAILKQNNIRCKLITLSGGPRGMVCYGGNNQITQVLKVNKDDSYNARKILEEIDG